MEIIKFMYEHWVLTTWFLLLICGGRILTFRKSICKSCKCKNNNVSGK